MKSKLSRILILGSVMLAALISTLSFAEEFLQQGDLESLRLDTLDKQVIGLGDVWHTSGGFYEVKAQVIKHLITDGTLRRLAWEESWNSGEMVNTWLQTCDIDAGKIIAKLRFIWHAEEIKSLFKWLCKWNQTHADDKVTFIGFDIQDTWKDIAVVEQTFSNSKPEMVTKIRSNCFGASAHSKEEYTATTDYAQLSRAMAGQFSEFPVRRDEICQTSIDDLRAAASTSNYVVRLALAAVIGNHHALVARIRGHVAKSDQLRDAAMFAVLQSQMKNIPNLQTAIWTPNYHMATANMHLLGDLVSQTYGEEYFPIGMAALQVGFNWPSQNAVGMQPPANGANSLEVALASKGLFNRYLSINGAELSPLVNYLLQTDTAPIKDQYRGLIFLRSSPGMTICCQ